MIEGHPPQHKAILPHSKTLTTVAYAASEGCPWVGRIGRPKARWVPVIVLLCAPELHVRILQTLKLVQGENTGPTPLDTFALVTS